MGVSRRDPTCACASPRGLLQRDEAVLRQLLQQELKKRESLKAAEAKVAKLREQLQASEKIVGANRTLLKKLQEQVGAGGQGEGRGPHRGWGLSAVWFSPDPPLQVHRVEHRVSIKKSVAARLEQELVQAQLVAGRRAKRQAAFNHLPVSSDTPTFLLLSARRLLTGLQVFSPAF